MSSAHPVPPSAPGDTRAEETGRAWHETLDALAAEALERDEQGVLDLLAERAASLIGGTAAVAVAAADGTFAVRAVASTDLGSERVARAMLPAAYPASAGHTWIRSEATLIPELDEGTRAAARAAVPPALRAWHERFEAGSVATAPLVVRGEVIGRASVARLVGEPALGPADRDLLAAMTARVAGVFVAASERARAEAAARRAEIAVERMRALDEFYRAAVTRDVQGVFEVLAERVAALFGGPCSVYSLDPDGTLVMRTVASPDPDEQALGRSLMPVSYPPDSPVVPAWLTGDPVLTPRVGPGELAAMLASVSPAVRPYYERHPVETLVAAPLQHGGTVVGRVSVARSVGHGVPFTEEDRDLLLAIADRASLVLEAAASRAEATTTAQRLRALLEQSPIATGIIDHTGILTSWNEAAERMFGWPAAEVLGRRPPIVPPDLVEVTETIWAGVFRGERVVGHETRRLARDGREVPVALYDTPLLEPDGTVGSAVLRMVDLTERQRFAERLLQASKLESIGRLAGGVAHDFNNIVHVVRANAEMIAEDPSDPAVAVMARAIIDASDRATLVVQQLGSFARTRAVERRPVDPAAVIRDLRAWTWIPARVDLRVSVEPGAGLVLGDATEIGRVLLNLVSNAVDAMPDGGRLSIALGPWVVDDDSLLEQHQELPPGRYVRLVVTDEGVGMDAETRARIWDPYFTTKEAGPGGGIGLGLSTVHGIVEDMGGRIWVCSHPGRGTSFHVYLPRIAVDAPAREPVPARPRPRVMLVEDDRHVREVAERALRRREYDLLVAEDGVAAEEAWEAAGRPELAFLLTDVEMPRRSGVSLARALRDHQPALPVIATSGFPRDHHAALDELAAEPAPFAYLDKPYTVGRLRQAIDDLLGEGAG